jgi:hypothetical protein
MNTPQKIILQQQQQQQQAYTRPLITMSSTNTSFNIISTFK